MKEKYLILISILLSFLFGFFGAGLAIKYFYRSSLGVSSPSSSFSQFPQGRVIFSQENQVIDVVERTSPSVVSIVATKDLPVFKEYWYSPFEFFPEFKIPKYKEEKTEKRKVGAGSGFIISSDGLILTNRHVVEEKDVEYTVILHNEKKYKAEILVRDPIFDLAILKIKAKDLIPAKLGDSDKLKVGQTVIAVGYALGEFKNTVSVGVVSGLKRNIVAQSTMGKLEELQEVIQTDAAINQGNSGGPLLNISGEVIGINVAMAQEAENIGFAIPINQAKRTIEIFKEKGKITYPFLGVIYLNIDKDLKEKYNLPVDYGALIVKGKERIAVIPGSAADIAGLQENDIILELNQEKITPKNYLGKVILKYKPGDEVELKILRKGKEMKLKAKLQER